MSGTLDYKAAGVDIDTANQTKAGLKGALETSDPRVLNGLGAYGSLYDFSFPEYKNPVLVLKTEEPGSKQLLAFQHDRFESICYDMINHLINDCIVMGAKPLTVQDAIICGKLEKDKVTRMVDAIARACKEQGCVLTGGETSEQPKVIPVGTYILTSSIVGIAEKEAIIDGSKIEAGDDVIALESSGLHTNGYSLVRALLEKTPGLEKSLVQGKPFLDWLLEPHRCYYNTIKDLFPKGQIRGIAHITGGGIKENLNRILPSNVDAQISLDSMKILPIFGAIKKAGKIEDNEMLRTFNLGVGLTIVCKAKHSENIMTHVQSQNCRAYKLGTIAPGNGVVKEKGVLNWA